MHKLPMLLIYSCIVTTVFSLLAPANSQEPAAQAKSLETQDISTGNAAADQAPDLWFGVLKTANRNFRFILELSSNLKDTEGKLRSLDEGNRTFDLTRVSRSDVNLIFELPLTSASYESTMNAKGTQTNGFWIQRGQQIPLSFAKVSSIPKRKVKQVLAGTLNALLQKIEVAFVELETGEIYFNSVSQKAGGFVATKEVGDDGEVVLRVPGVQGVFTGHFLDARKTQLQGKWNQGPIALSLKLTQQDVSTEVAAPIPPQKPHRPQTPRGPFPYTTELVSIPSPEEDVTLAGTLTLPKSKPKAGVILVSGSGPQDRDETIFNHKPFLVIADHFARHGIATLRYDDRGIASSTGDFSSANSFDLAKDAESAFNFLSKRPAMLDVPLGICGHSEGGLIAPLIAARNKRVDFVILMAAPGVDGRQIILSQGPLIMRAQGIPENVISANQKTKQVILKLIREHEHPSGDLVAEKISESYGHDQADLSEIIEAAQAAIEKQASPWLRTFLKLDPKQALSELRCPVLAINGTKDLQVDPVLNLTAIRETLQAAGNTNVEINLYPGLNHLFQNSNTGLPAEYGTIEETFNLVPLRRMTSWTLEQAATK